RTDIHRACIAEYARAGEVAAVLDGEAARCGVVGEVRQGVQARMINEVRVRPVQQDGGCVVDDFTASVTQGIDLQGSRVGHGAIHVIRAAGEGIAAEVGEVPLEELQQVTSVGLQRAVVGYGSVFDQQRRSQRPTGGVGQNGSSRLVDHGRAVVVQGAALNGSAVELHRGARAVGRDDAAAGIVHRGGDQLQVSAVIRLDQAQVVKHSILESESRGQRSTSRVGIDDASRVVVEDRAIVVDDAFALDGVIDEVQVGFCHITAPISGRVGLRLVDPGNLVQSAGTVILAVITQLEPITVIFTIPEDSLGPVEVRLRAKATLAVDAFDRTALAKIASGKLL